MVVLVFFGNLSRKFKFYFNMRRIESALHRDLCTFIIISRYILLRMRNISDKILEEIQTHVIMFSSFMPNILPFMR